MKLKFLTQVLSLVMVASAAWCVHKPVDVRADDVSAVPSQSISKGLEYLAKHQHKDGHWEGDEGRHPVAMTGLVGLAMSMESFGSRVSQQDVKHWATVRKAADWLMDRSQTRRDGLIFSNHDSETANYMHGHGLATIFLANVRRREDDKSRLQRLDDVLSKSVKYISKAQSSSGGWYNTSIVEGHDFQAVLATVIQIQALRAAMKVEVPFSYDTLNDGMTSLSSIEKLADAANPEEVKFRRKRTMDFAGWLACLAMVVPNSTAQTWLDNFERDFPIEREIGFGRELIHYFYGQAAYNLSHPTCQKYRAVVFPALQKGQDQDGSWPAATGLGVGRVYSTAVWCTVLQLDGDSHPSLYRVRELTR